MTTGMNSHKENKSLLKDIMISERILSIKTYILNLCLKLLKHFKNDNLEIFEAYTECNKNK